MSAAHPWDLDPAYDAVHRAAAPGVCRFAPPLTARRRVGLASCRSMADHRPIGPGGPWAEAAAGSEDQQWGALIPPRKHPPGVLLTHNAAAASKERPARLLDTLDELERSGAAGLCLPIAPRLASRAELCSVHTAGHVEMVLGLEGERALLEAQMRSNYVWLGPESVRSALTAAGCAVQCVEEVIDGAAEHAVAVVRPPGHHAGCGCMEGFCVFNNVAVAAGRALALGLERVLVVDWDVHHGDGTQQIFESDPRCLCFSVHRWDWGIFYPGSYYQEINQPVPGRPDNIGSGPGLGYSINVGWDCVSTGTPMGDPEYAAAWQAVLMPVAREYNPQLVLVSAGFDAAKGDPEGECLVTPEGYAHLTSELLSLGAPVVVVLEGGYNTASVKFGLGAVLSVLLGAEAPERGSFGEPNAAGLAAINETIQALQGKWKGIG